MSSSSLAILGDVGDNPLAYWDEITWETEEQLDKEEERDEGTAFADHSDAAYESEIQRCPYSVPLWSMYLASRKKSSSRVRFAIYERAVKVLPRSYKLWYRYLQVSGI